jgi:oligoribonuclease
MIDAALAPDDHNLVWIDLEMTGLSPERDRIIEIAVVVTDAQLGRRTEGPVLAIHQSDATLATMDAWNTGTHGRSGLTDRVRFSIVGFTTSQRRGDQLVLRLLQLAFRHGRCRQLCEFTADDLLGFRGLVTAA